VLDALTERDFRREFYYFYGIQELVAWRQEGAVNSGPENTESLMTFTRGRQRQSARQLSRQRLTNQSVMGSNPDSQDGID
jgi:hypothetical protein